jgi:hypothetical protein
MSDTNTDDPVLDHLWQRKRDLEISAAETAARLAEIDRLLKTLGDGRTRVRRKQKDAAAPGTGTAEQPQEAP